MNPDKAAILEALTAEQYTSPWWTHKPAPRAHALTQRDDDLTIARRRRELLEACDGDEHEEAL